MTEGTIKVERDTIDIPVSMVEDVIDTAGYSIAYWAKAAMVYEDNQTYTVAPHEPLTDDAPKNYTLTYAEIAKAIVKLADGGANVRDEFVTMAQRALTPDGDAGDIDGDAADMIIQLAAFGEVVFG